ncbi:MAG TPA: ATP-dependent zinc metalloprotease FtsH [Solirubrobacterales bacterium]|nr:ATP-dependent zinc metalloprotease FtsH [Solirubrobacterales bacterium]
MRRPSPQVLRLLPLFLVAVVVFEFAMSRSTTPAHTTKPVDLSQLIARVEAKPGSVSRVVFDPGSLLVTATLVGGNAVAANYPSDQSALGLQTLLERKKVAFAAKAPSHKSALTSILESFLPLLLIAAVWIFVMRRMRGGGGGGLGQVMSFGKHKATRLAPDLPKVGFKDVAGVDEAVEELQEIKEFLADPRRFQALGARIPKGVLLYGPPGTGKTLLARAVAGEAGVAFFSISGSDFVEMFVGVGASRVRDLFKEAKEAAPCIVFVDELDAVGRHRGTGIGGGNDEREQTLNQLLVEMDGFNANQNIILIGATNRPDVLDPALLRPGRFDRQIVVDRPDRVGRRKILAVHARGKPLAPEVDLDSLAAGTPGLTGAELSNLINEAALLAARRGLTAIGQAELEEGVMRVIAGPERKTRVFSELERRITAYHEMGHALVGHFLEHTDPVHKISIVSRGQALGLTVSLPTEDRFLTSRSALMDQLAMVLGGRAAEELVFQEITTGAANDLERATTMARQMVTRLGMSEKLGPRVFGSDPHQPFLGRELGTEPSYSEEMAQEIDEEIYRLIDDAHQRAAKVLLDHQPALHEIAAILIEHETIDKEQFERLLHGEPASDVLTNEVPPKPAKHAKRRSTGTRTPKPRRAPVAKPLPDTAVAHAVAPDERAS